MEGLADSGELHPYNNASLRAQLFNAGSARPGSFMAAKALLDKNPDPTETEIRYALAGNLCRCTGYDKIIRAVQEAAREMRGQ